MMCKGLAEPIQHHTCCPSKLEAHKKNGLNAKQRLVRVEIIEIRPLLSHMRLSICIQLVIRSTNLKQKLDIAWY